MKILAIDTSSTNASVAILEEQNILIELNNEDEKTHSQKLMPMIDQAFQSTNLSLNDIGLICCCVGPGSFTGVRIGIATAKAFADSKHISTVGVTSLESLAYNLNQDGYICSLINANHDNVYAGFFHINNCQTLESSFAFLDLKIENGKNLVNFLENNSTFSLSNSPIYFVGDAVPIYDDLLNSLILKGKNKIILANKLQCTISSISIAKIGYTKYKNDCKCDSNSLSPIYLRKSQAEIALEEKGVKI